MTYSVPFELNPKFSNKILITFGEIGSDIDDSGFGASAAMNLGVRFVYFSQRKGTQYQHLSRDTVKGIIDQYFRDSELYFYGTSLGGYCALYFGSSVDANILAMAPRIPCHPVIHKIMAVKFPNEGYLHDGIGPERTPTHSRRRYVFYDEDNYVDNFYASAYLHPELDRSVVGYMQVNYAGHYVPKALALSGYLKSTLYSFIVDESIDFKIDRSQVVAWHKKRFAHFAIKNKIGYASEHLSALIPHLGAYELTELTSMLQESR